MRLNPNQPLRDAYITALSAIGLPVKSKKIPKNSSAVQQYILITSQIKKRTCISKDCYDYLCSISVDINYFSPNGYVDSNKNDDIEGQVVNIIEDGIEVDGFMVKSSDFVQSIPLDIETPTYSIQRQIITYQHWLGQITNLSNGFPYTLPFTLS
jgi:hypothetical protein